MDRKLAILFGSQNGNAQAVAERIWQESKCYYFEGPVLPLDEYEISKLPSEDLVIFVCSTTGQGDEPENMKTSWKYLLRKSLPLDSLRNVKFAVLGLGDSSYAKFNFVAKKLHRRLLQLGGTSLCEIGLADDQHDLGADAVVDSWIKELWNVLKIVKPLPDDLPPMHADVLFPPRWYIEIYPDNPQDKPHVSKCFPNDLLNQMNAASVKCISNERVTAENHFQDVRLIKFTPETISYEPGDVLMVRPRNQEEDVQKFLKLLEERPDDPLDGNKVIHVFSRFPDMPVPKMLNDAVAIKDVVTYYWDLNMVPKRYSFQILSYFTESELERDKLIEFTTPEGQQELYNYCNRPKRTILEVLLDFPQATATIPLEYFFEILQPIRPRAFSIASSPKAHQNEIHILVAVVDYKTNLVKRRRGLCSSWLAKLKCEDSVDICVRKGSFTFPTDEAIINNDLRILMLGPGTGVAPFRSFIMDQASKSVPSNRLTLFFGCRNHSGDFYFQDEWKKLVEENKLKLHVAFSRDQPEKRYVQHLLDEESNMIGAMLLSEHYRVYVAGNAKNMPQSIREALIRTLQKQALSVDEAEKYITSMEMCGRYQTETWS